MRSLAMLLTSAATLACAQDVLKDSPAGDWRDLDPANTLYVELPAGRVVIELAPAYAPANVEAVRKKHKQTWLVHCYGSVGVGRDNAADSGNGSELYAVIGQSPRGLDRNITLVGRVVRGIELFSVMPRGTGAMGFYEKPSEWIPIRATRLAADLPANEQVNLEVLRTDSATFKAYVESRATRREEWFKEPIGRLGVCNLPVPVRVKKD